MSFKIIINDYKKTEDDYFRDWFSSAFPYGYGTGDEFFIKALKDVFDYMKSNEDKYHYEDLEEMFSPAFAWFIINKLCELHIFEYGTSPRFAWIGHSPKIRRIYHFIVEKSNEELMAIIDSPEDYIECYHHYCNHTNLEDKGCLLNPFFYD
jgi:hypothetical protein